jgi:mRNA interferase HigB
MLAVIMRVVAYGHLRTYGLQLPEAASSLRRWYNVARKARWRTTTEVLTDFGGAKVLNAERVRFAIHGGHYRMIVAFDFPRQTLYIKFMGTHAEYDAIDALVVAQF